MESNNVQKTLMSIDPSINSTGWAIFENAKLIKYGVLKTKSGDNERLYELQCEIDKLLSQCVITEAVIEKPGSVIYNNRKNMYGKPIAIDGLIKCNMAYSHICTRLIHWTINTTSVIAKCWKGKRSKAVDMALASNIAGVKIKTDHEADAIMLGMWFLARVK